MIDIHSHILHGWDDGSPSLEQSVRMLEIAAATGTSDIVATPHANSEYRFDEAVVRARFEELSAAAPKSITLHLGCDFHISYENVTDALLNPARYTINGLNYLMVELPNLVAPDSARQILGKLREIGVIPVITHPERNPQVQFQYDVLQSWISDGCLMQVTAQSLLGRFGPRAGRSASTLLERGMVHIIASDAHDCEDRPPRLDLAHAFIKEKYGQELADRLLSENPGAVIAGEAIIKESAPQRRKWYKFWN
jgi:protein-tyrosine phosphatase